MHRACICACRGMGVCCQDRRCPCSRGSWLKEVSHLYPLPSEGPRLGEDPSGSVIHILTALGDSMVPGESKRRLLLPVFTGSSSGSCSCFPEDPSFQTWGTWQGTCLAWAAGLVTMGKQFSLSVDSSAPLSLSMPVNVWFLWHRGCKAPVKVNSFS